MSLKQSTGLRNYMLLTGSLKTAMDLGYINIYAGNVPATADAALDGTNTVLCKITNASSATGLTFANTDSGGSIAKNSSEVWSGINAATGTATFYRHVAVGDDGTLSTTQSRLQGLVATSGGELNLTNTALVSGATQTVDYYTINQPTL